MVEAFCLVDSEAESEYRPDNLASKPLAFLFFAKRLSKRPRIRGKVKKESELTIVI